MRSGSQCAVLRAATWTVCNDEQHAAGHFLGNDSHPEFHSGLGGRVCIARCEIESRCCKSGKGKRHEAEHQGLI